jgi:hypothetical protein
LRASFSSLTGVEAERLAPMAAGAGRRLVLAVLRPFARLALRALASLVLLPVLDDRLISAPGVKTHILSDKTVPQEGGDWLRRTVPAGNQMPETGEKRS